MTEAAIEEHRPHVLHMIAGSRLDILVGVDTWNREQYTDPLKFSHIDFNEDDNGRMAFPPFFIMYSLASDEDWKEYTGQDRIILSELARLVPGDNQSQEAVEAIGWELLYRLHEDNKVDAREFYERRIDKAWDHLTKWYDSDFISFQGEGDAWICRIGYGLSNG
jgi:hypothetical protein